ncbi:MAG TPA: membrane dipeptidase [Thermodesulfobacteriota bacterium]|nr:membrane dipeptidase [Thermodesulfobacteriota bacterium]
MNRRQFLRSSAFYGLSVSLGNVSSFAQSFSASKKDQPLSKDLQIIDAHAHPDRYVYNSRATDHTSTLRAIKKLGMVASCFAAVGDSVFLNQGRVPGTEYHSTKAQLEWWLKGIVKPGKVKLVLKASDVPAAVNEESPPGAILGVEGGDALKGNPDAVNEFYGIGVRIITLIHYRNNEIGDTMKMWRNLSPGPSSNGLTPAGCNVVERMQDLGLVVDVAHAQSATLKQIVEMSSRPLVDSHTNPCSIEDPLQCGRSRTWKEMEWIAKTGGVVCTWPLAYTRGATTRITFSDWAKEIREMKSRLGIEHIGLGTDGGGDLPGFIEGYRDIGDLQKLIMAMQEVGLSHDDIAAYMGRNFHRVLRSCIG